MQVFLNDKLSGSPFHRSAGKSNTEKPSQEFHQIISLFFNVCYYALVSPFCIRRSHEGFYRVQTNKIQQVFTFIMQGLMVVFVILSYNPFEHNILQKPQYLFDLISKPAYCLILTITFHTFWTKRSELEAILTASQNETITNKNMRSYFPLFTFLWIMHICFAYCVGIIYYGFDALVEVTYAKYYRGFVQRLGFGYLIKTPYKDLTTEEQIGMSAYAVFIMYFECFSGFLPFIIFICAYIVYLQSLEFHHLLLSDTKNINMVVQRYRFTRNFTKLVSKFVGPLIPLHLITVMCFYLYEIFEYWDPDSIYLQISVLLHLKNVLYLFVAAEGNRKFGYLKEWLYQYQCEELDTENVLIEDAKCKKLLAFLQNQSTTEIGLSSWATAVLNYSTIKVLISIYATYIFLQLQLYGGKVGARSVYLGFPSNQTG